MFKKLWLLLLGFLFFLTPVSANSAPMEWEGRDGVGTLILDEDCPIEVTGEKLTFVIEQFPELNDEEPQTQYDAHVSAQYTFHNPEDYTVSAHLVFPFGSRTDYGSEEFLRQTLEKYDITINSEPVEKQVRHTYQNPEEPFNLEIDAARLQDEYIRDDFFTDDLSVTSLIYRIDEVDLETYPAVRVSFDVTDLREDHFFYSSEINGGLVNEEKTANFQIALDDETEEIEILVFGDPVDELVWTFYTNGSLNQVIDGTMTLVSKETMIFKDLTFSQYDPESQILKHDWYNALIDCLRDRTENSFCFDGGSPFSVSSFMQWYDYEISIEPHSSIINTVSAPLFPDISMKYEPSVYTYTYLLSPAERWKSFKNLQIEIQTSAYLLNPSLTGFEKTETGYTLSLNELPDKELVFELCDSPSPEKIVNYSHSILYVIVSLIYYVIPSALVLGFIQFFRKSKI